MPLVSRTKLAVIKGRSVSSAHCDSRYAEIIYPKFQKQYRSIGHRASFNRTRLNLPQSYVPRTKSIKSSAGFVEPMLLLSSESLPDGPDWLYELKLDGYRALAIKADATVQLRSRNDNDFTLKYPRLPKALAAIPVETVLDGEVVALDASGRPSFNTLQNYSSTTAPFSTTSSTCWCSKAAMS